MDLDYIDNHLTNFTFSSAMFYPVELAQFHHSHGLPTPISGDKRYAEAGKDKVKRKQVAARISIWH